MAKTKKRITHTASRASRSRSFAVLLVVVATVMLGGLTLPKIFADTSSGVVTNLTATPSNSDAYAINVTWGGSTPHSWKGQRIGGGVTQDWVSNDKSIRFNGVSCNVPYTFRVAAAGKNGGTQSEWKSTTATTACPTVTWKTFARTGNNISMSWSGAPNFSSTYTLYTKTGSGSYVRSVTTATSSTIPGTCGTAYTVYITATAGSQTGPASTTQSTTTDPCPPSGGGNTGGGGTTGGGTTGGGTNTGGSGSNTGGTSNTGGGTKPAPKNNSTAKPAAPATPVNFSAEVVSNKIVELSWDPDAAVDHYVLNRTGDEGATWQQITSTKEHTYRDEETDFSATYTYQLQAVNAAGQASPFANAQVSTEAFTATDNKIDSDDGLVTVVIPAGAIDGEHSCSVSSDETSAGKLPADKSVLLGPDVLSCVYADGATVRSFNKPLTVTMNLATVADGYTNISAATFQGDEWKTVESKYDPETRQLTFNIGGNAAFAAFATKQSSVWGVIIVIFLLILLVGGLLAAYFLWWRRRNGDDYYPPLDMPTATVPETPQAAPALSTAAQNQLTAEREFRQALAQPDCSHLSQAQQVIPTGLGCYECEQQGTKWKALRICLICGHVGCSDDSPQQHALKHFQETGHPLIYEYGNAAGNTIGWCYVDQTYI